MLQEWSTWRVLRSFMKRPRKKFQIRGLGREVGLAVTSVSNILERLEKKGLVKRVERGVYPGYVARYGEERFRRLKVIGTLEELYESGLVDLLRDKCGADAIFLFGSCSRGEEIGESDIDLFVQGEEVGIDLSQFEERLGREIRLLFAESLDRFPAELRNNILNGVRLDGYVKVF